MVQFPNHMSFEKVTISWSLVHFGRQITCWENYIIFMSTSKSCYQIFYHKLLDLLSLLWIHLIQDIGITCSQIIVWIRNWHDMLSRRPMDSSHGESNLEPYNCQANCPTKLAGTGSWFYGNQEFPCPNFLIVCMLHFWLWSNKCYMFYIICLKFCLVGSDFINSLV